MSINGEIITTSGFYGSYFGSPKTPYWNGHGRKDDYDLKSVEMLINGKDITTSGFCGSHFGGPKHSHWT